MDFYSLDMINEWIFWSWGKPENPYINIWREVISLNFIGFFCQFFSLSLDPDFAWLVGLDKKFQSMRGMTGIYIYSLSYTPPPPPISRKSNVPPTRRELFSFYFICLVFPAESTFYLFPPPFRSNSILKNIYPME